MQPLSLRHYQRNVTTHQHDYAQLVMPVDGPLEIEVAGRGTCLQPGQACVIVPGERHDFAADACHGFVVQESGWLPQGLEGPFMTLDASQRAYLHFMHTALCEGRAQPGVGELWLSLLATGRGIGERIARVQRHIEAHLAASLSTGELAAVACLGQSRFSQLCRRELGMSPQQYVAERRMAHAARLLLGSRLPVGEVAARVGYDNPAAFAERFAAHYGTTPSRWRTAQSAA